MFALSTTKQPHDEALIGCDTVKLIFPNASVLLKELAQEVPAGVAKFIVEAGVVELDDELDESLPPPPQANKKAERTPIKVRLLRVLTRQLFIEINAIQLS